MAKIDIDRLTEHEPRELNHQIDARIRILQQKRSQSQTLTFNLGERENDGSAFSPRSTKKSD